MIFDLIKDFYDALATMPADHPRRRVLSLLEEAIRRDVHFIDQHPTTMFQCMWNTCWWYDCDEAAEHYVEPRGGWTVENATWRRPEEEKLSMLLSRWRMAREESVSLVPWIRSHRPSACSPGHGTRGRLART